MNRLYSELWQSALIGLAYYLGAWIGVNQTITSEGIAILWPPNAVLLTAFLLMPRRAWPLVMLAALAAEVLADYPHFPLWAALSFGTINLFETLLAASVLRYRSAGSFDFDSLRSGALFLLAAPLVASVVAALLGAGIYILLGEEGYWVLWRLWWFGDALGLLLLTPPLILLMHLYRNRQAIDQRRLGEMLLLCLFVVIAGNAVFSHSTGETVLFHLSPILLLPFGIVAAIRLGVLGAAVTVVVIAAIAVNQLVAGNHPFGDIGAEQAVWQLQEYLAITAVLSVGLAILLYEIRQQRNRLNLQERAMNSTNDAIVITDVGQPDNPLIWVNPQFERMFGYRADEVLGLNCRFLHGDDQEQEQLRILKRAIAERKPCRVVLRNYTKAGELIWNDLNIAPVHDDHGEVTHFVGVQHDMTDIKQTEEALRSAKQELGQQNERLEQRVQERTNALQKANDQLQQLADIDPLTGVANRRHFQELAEREMSRNATSVTPISLLIFDLDHFKRVNDTYGHDAGDQVLRAVVSSVQKALRPMDLIGRFGGEEFLILLPQGDKSAALATAERVRAAIANSPVKLEVTTLPVTASFGVAQWDGKTSFNEWVVECDRQLYRAKEAGRNCIR